MKCLRIRALVRLSLETVCSASFDDNDMSPFLQRFFFSLSVLYCLPDSPTTCKNMSLSSCLFLRMSQSSIKLSIPLSGYIEICIDISIHQPFLFSIHISRELTLSQGTDLRTGNSAPSMSRLSETSCPQSTVINGL